MIDEDTADLVMSLTAAKYSKEAIRSALLESDGDPDLAIQMLLDS